MTSSRWEIASDNTPWLLSARQRTRGSWKVCEGCGKQFPALPRGRFCTRSCSGQDSHPPTGNQTLFTRPSGEESWLAGLIWADGSLTHRRVRLATSDREMAEHAARITGRSIGEYADPRGYKTMYDVAIAGAPVARLAALGLSSGKTAGGGLPKFDGVLRAAEFVRGFFDGDGSVSLYQPKGCRPGTLRLKANFVGTEESLRDLMAILYDEAEINPKALVRYKATYVRKVYLNHADSLRLADFMYALPGPCLSRKRAIFDTGRAIAPGWW